MLSSLRIGLRACKAPTCARTSVRAFQSFGPTWAKVTAPNPFAPSHSIGNNARHGADASTLVSDGDESQDRRTILQLKKERKLKEYEAKVRMKAAQLGKSVDELKEQALMKPRFQPPPPIIDEPQVTASASSLSDVEREDQRVLKTIQERSKAEAARKLASGMLQSTPVGAQEGPIKPLSSILDLEKVHDQDAATITKLWTGYHIIKNKLSGVIPHERYAQMVAKAKQYPQFVLPLPRKVVSDAAESAGEERNAFEMNFMEWAILPSPTGSSTGSTLPPSTTMFTPLAEYKLKQDFSQPVLILTHYTDLAESHGIVLMRGEITNLNEKTGKGGRIDQKEAQLLSLTLQRFYLPNNDADGRSCAQLLESFHTKPEQFDVDKLVQTAFQFKL